MQSEHAADSGTTFELLGLPFQGRVQTEIVQSSGSEIGGDSSQGANHFVHQSNRGVNFGPQLSLAFGCLATDQREIHLDCRTRLAKFVVDLSSDGGTLFFPDALEPCLKRAELLEGGFKLFLSALAFRDFSSQLVVYLGKDVGSLFEANFQQLFGLFERFFFSMAIGHVPGDLGKPLQTSLSVP